MHLGEIGAILLVLLGITVFGTLWFHLVEALLARVRRLFAGRREPPAWHPLPPDEREENDR